MEIIKKDNYCEIYIDNQRFVLDPPNSAETPPLIFTDPSLNLNKDKIFNSPGEYNVGNVYIWGFADINYISYLFESKEGRVFYLIEKLSEETIKKIKVNKFDIDALIIKNKKEIDAQILQFKPRVIFSFKDIDLPKFQKQKASRIKVNLNKVKNLIYILQ